MRIALAAAPVAAVSGLLILAPRLREPSAPAPAADVRGRGAIEIRLDKTRFGESEAITGTVFFRLREKSGVLEPQMPEFTASFPEDAFRAPLIALRVRPTKELLNAEIDRLYELPFAIDVDAALSSQLESRGDPLALFSVGRHRLSVTVTQRESMHSGQFRAFGPFTSPDVDVEIIADGARPLDRAKLLSEIPRASGRLREAMIDFGGDRAVLLDSDLLLLGDRLDVPGKGAVAEAYARRGGDLAALRFFERPGVPEKPLDVAGGWHDDSSDRGSRWATDSAAFVHALAPHETLDLRIDCVELHNFHVVPRPAHLRVEGCENFAAPPGTRTVTLRAPASPGIYRVTCDITRQHVWGWILVRPS